MTNPYRLWKDIRVHARARLEVQNLTKSYPTAAGLLTVLSDVSLALAAGETCAIVGPSGSGKTTLLGLCAGLDFPSAGRVFIDGIDLFALDEDGRARLRRERVGFVFQNFQLIPTLTAAENVLVPSELSGRRPARSEAIELLDKVGLLSREDHYPAQLSGGEQQRVGLARAFINRPLILFADEPTGNLDAETSHRVIDLLFDLNAARGTTLVLVTHNLELAGRADRTIQLRGGRVAGERSKGDYPSCA